MVEKWLITVRNRAAGPGAAMVARIWAFSPGLWVAGAVIAMVGIQAMRAHPDQVNWRRQVAAAFGAANTFYGSPQMNHDGSQFTYVATTDARGCGLFLCDTRTKQARQIAFEEDGLGGWHDDYELRAWPWAPDDSAVVYTMKDKLAVCPLDTNKQLAEMTVQTDSVSQLAWLTPSMFVFVQSATNLCCARQQENGQWQYQYCPVPSYDGIASLTAVSTNTIAWLQAGLICRLDLDKSMLETQQTQTANAVPASEGAARLQKASPALVFGAESAPLAEWLVLWLDASTLEQPDQTPVLRLVDLSASRNVAVANGNPPLFNAPDGPGALNGKGTIHFSSGTAIRNATSLRTDRSLGVKGSTPRTIYAVARRQAGKQMLINTGRFGSPREYCGLVDDERNIYLPSGGGSGAENAFRALIPRWNILSVVYDGSSERGFVNGVLKGVSHFTLDTPDAEVELGVRVTKDGNMGQAQASDGDFAEMLVYDRALNAAEQQQVENYLSRKWFGGALLTPQNPLVWVNPEMKGATEMAYSRATGRLLIRVEDGPQKTLWLCDSNSAFSEIMPANSVSGAQWAGPDGFAYVIGGATRSQIVVADIHGAAKSRLSNRGNIRSFTLAPTGDRMLFVGIVSNEPSYGVWQYDLRTGELQDMVSYSAHPFPNAKGVPAFRSDFRNGRSQLSCTIYPPPKVERGKKYPLVISDTLISDAIHGPMFQSGIAGSGAYVAIVERPWWPVDIEQWATNVWTLYEDLKRDPTVDRQRIYLFAASAETQYLSDLVEKMPGPWRGLILLNPGKLPDFSKAPLFQPRPKILICAGGEEHEDARFKKYQQDALQWGVSVEVHIAPGETHRFVGKAGKLQRAEAVMRFIFEE